MFELNGEQIVKIVGITGPSGSGKSLLCEYLSEVGIPSINADDVYHSLLIPPSRCIDAIKNEFGERVLAPDGSLDRAELSALVFSDSDKLELLNRTVLPIVIDEIRRIINELRSRGEIAVAIDAPTLIESGFHLECDLVVAMTAPTDERIDRIEARDNISEDRAKMRAKAQKPTSFYTSHAHITVVNDGGAEELRRKALDLADKIKKL